MPFVPIRHLFCFGLGYSAGIFCQQLQAQGVAISGTCRTAEKAAKHSSTGFKAYVFSREQPLIQFTEALKTADAILISVPPDEQGDPVFDRHGSDIAALSGQLHWVGYLSTTGVYGDRGGDWVAEDADLRPVGERGRRRVVAEMDWLSLWHQYRLPIHFFRLAGIYGPGRNQLESLRAGKAQRVIKKDQVFSRIHVEDIAATLSASLAQPNPGQAYNVCDNQPAPPQDVIAFAAKLLGQSTPPDIPFEAAQLSPMGRSFYEENKRVANDLMKRELGVTLRYPTYREGLQALFAQLTDHGEGL